MRYGGARPFSIPYTTFAKNIKKRLARATNARSET